MKTTSLRSLLGRIAGEYMAKDSIYGIPGGFFREVFSLETESPGLNVMSGRASLPVGPAAGPHTQIAPNLVAAYLSGARVFELKTVQENDHLEVEKPCIDALDEGHNVEWSTELSLEEARKEYVNGWIAVNLLAYLFSRKPGEFFFNMSVGYTLDGIKGAKVDAFIEGMRRPEITAYWAQAMSELGGFMEGGLFSGAFGGANTEKARALASHMPVRPVHSVTLSTMHGCPPEEIEKIGRYLIEEKGFDTYIKMNPTLVGYDRARSILDALGWDDIVLKRESFERDLQFDRAVELVNTLEGVAAARGRRFGIKLSNTLANVNNGERLPGGERYMSGRALAPLTLRLAADLAKALPDFGSRFSYCGGVSAFNAAELAQAGLGPLTVATDILKPGGYQRLAQIASEAAKGLGAMPEGESRRETPDAEALERLADAALDKPEYMKSWKTGIVSIPKKLPLFDCFAAPCVEACPVNQKVPAYVRALGMDKPEEALAAILSDNPLPFMTGVLCDHVCQEHCSRIDYEGPVRIRDAKLTAARKAGVSSAPRPAGADPATGKRQGMPPKTAVIGAGPAGLACAFQLAMAGLPVTVFDRDIEAGGVPANVIPPFRIRREDLAADIGRVRSVGAEFAREAVESLEDLRGRGFDAFFVATGARKARELRIQGYIPTMDALEFLSAFSAEGAARFAGIRRVIVAGGGNTACDAVRAATRIPGVESVQLSYRRTRREMPADAEELENAIAEAERLTGASSPLHTRVLFELSVPEAADGKKVTFRVMALGEKDSSGRRSPVPADGTFDLPCDLLVSAIGEEPDRDFLERLGIELGQGGLPVADPGTLESRVRNVYVGGDALRGPSSIIAAEADGRKAAAAILARAGFAVPAADYHPPRPDTEKLNRRGEMIPSVAVDDPAFAAREAERCLACDSACLRCVEVCPNRANVFLETGAPFAQYAQILHVDRLCNECGNCGFFCPYEGEPFRGKPTLFDNIDDLARSDNAGFAFERSGPLPSLALRTAAGGGFHKLDYASWNGASSLPGAECLVALAREVWRNHSYLLEDAHDLL